MNYKKKSILLCTLPGDLSGVPRYAAFVAEGLKDQFEFVILTKENGSIFDNASCKVHAEPSLENSLSPLKIFNNFRILKNMIEKNNFDIVHLNGSMFGLVGRLLSLKYRNIKFIYTLHGKTWGGNRSFLNSIFMKCIEKLLAHTAINTICISKKDFDAYKQITNKKISYIPNSVSFKDSNFSYEYDVAGKNKNIICVARFDKQKNLSRLFKAFNKINNQCKLFLVGEGTNSKDCIKLAKSLMDNQSFQNIEFVGKTNNVEKYLKKATIFTLSSDYEGMPLSALEASYFNIPVIMPDVGGAYEIANHGSGYIYSPNTSQALCHAIKMHLDAPEKLQKLSQNSASNFQLFSAEKTLLGPWQKCTHEKNLLFWL